LLPRLVGATLVAGALLFAPCAANATLTTGACLAQKQTAWGDLRKCQATERAKVLRGKLGDLTKCQIKFQEKLAKITAKATKATIVCRYGTNGDGTVTDYDTGLQWETKNGDVGGVCLIFVDRPNHCVNSTYTWVDAQSFVGSLNGSSADGLILTNPFAGSADWRLPTIAELRTILDTTVLGCASGSPCLDPIFGPTIGNFYWSATANATNPANAWLVIFFNGGVFFSGSKANDFPVRAVRTGL
jgi:hypothetical protein